MQEIDVTYRWHQFPACLPGGQLSSNCVENKNETGLVTWISPALHWDDPFRQTASRGSLQTVYSLELCIDKRTKAILQCLVQKWMTELLCTMSFFPLSFLRFRKGTCMLTIPLIPLLLAFYVFKQVSVLILRVVAPFRLSLFKQPLYTREIHSVMLSTKYNMWVASGRKYMKL